MKPQKVERIGIGFVIGSAGRTAVTYRLENDHLAAQDPSESNKIAGWASVVCGSPDEIVTLELDDKSTLEILFMIGNEIVAMSAIRPVPPK